MDGQTHQNGSNSHQAPPANIDIAIEAATNTTNDDNDNFDLTTVIEVLQTVNTLPPDEKTKDMIENEKSLVCGEKRKNQTPGGTSASAQAVAPVEPPIIDKDEKLKGQGEAELAEGKLLATITSIGGAGAEDTILQQAFNRNDADNRVPGAYAVGGGGPEEASPSHFPNHNEDDNVQEDIEQPAAAAAADPARIASEDDVVDRVAAQNANLDSSSSSNHVVAVPVEEDDDSEIPLPEDLPHAMPFDTSNKSRSAVLRQKKAFVMTMVCLFLGLLVLIGVVVSVLLTKGGSADKVETTTSSSVNTNESNPELPPTAPPTGNPLETQVLQLFPDYTLASLKDPESPQARALTWLLEDPYLPQYIQKEWRVRQRFALTTLYHSTRGDEWNENAKWLNYSHHECSWFASDNFAFPMPGIPSAYDSEYRNPCEQANVTSSPIIAEDDEPKDNDDDDESNQTYKNLWLWINELEGSLPAELFWLTSLRSMSLFGNNLEGAVLSSEIGLLRDLEAIAFSWTGIGGTIPSEFGQLSSLRFAAIEGNWLSGSIPSELGLLSDLGILFADSNVLTGTVPAEVFAGFGNVTDIYLDLNLLTGTLPTTIGLLTSAKEIMFFGNNITGPVSSVKLGCLWNGLKCTLRWPRTLRLTIQ